MKRTLLVTQLLLCILFSSSSYARVSPDEMRENLDRDGWTVHLSRGYGPLEMGLVGACIYFSGGAGTLACLGDVVRDAASSIGWDLLGRAIANQGSVIFGPGGLLVQVGTASHDKWFHGHNIKINYVYLRYKRSSSIPPTDHHAFASRKYSEYGITLSDSDNTHWGAHFVNVGLDRWMHDFRRDVVMRLFSQCGNLPDEPNHAHWAAHMANVSAERFLTDLHNDWRCQ